MIFTAAPVEAFGRDDDKLRPTKNVDHDEQRTSVFKKAWRGCRRTLPWHLDGVMARGGDCRSDRWFFLAQCTRQRIKSLCYRVHELPLTAADLCEDALSLGELISMVEMSLEHLWQSNPA